MRAEREAGYLPSENETTGLAPGRRYPVTDSTEISSACLLDVVRDVVGRGDMSPQALAEGIRGRLAADPDRGGGLVARAFAEGVTELAMYAQAGIANGCTAVDAEVEAAVVARRVVRPVLEAKLQTRLDELDRESAGETCCPKCEGPAGSRGRRSRGWTGMLGALDLSRRYTYCEPCKLGFAPAQKVLGLGDSEFTPRLEEVCTMLATTVPHGMAVTLAGKVCGIDVSIKAVEDMIERRSRSGPRTQWRRARRPRWRTWRSTV